MNIRYYSTRSHLRAHLVMQMQFFCVYRPYEESISKEMNNVMI